MTAIPEERWRAAQAWELEFWDRQNLPRPLWRRIGRTVLSAVGLREPHREPEYDDRNLWWQSQFDGYSALPARIENICELGCGPYTNVRLIREGRSIGAIHCSDPLAGHYVRYPRGWLGRAARSGEISVDASPAEECPFRDDYFHVTVMVNVLDHVRDPEKCLTEAIRITRSGGFLVFGQDLTAAGDRMPTNPGHPFTIAPGTLEPVMDVRFERVFYRVASRGEVAEPEMHCGALAYIGRKRG